MKQTPINKLSGLGQSFWYDNIHRAMLHNGELLRMVTEDDLRGLTSNPTIFEKAISSGTAYDEALEQLFHEQPDNDLRDSFFHLALQDIQGAADILHQVYQDTAGLDGYVSLEVAPDLADDTEASVAQAKELFGRLARPNAMIKIPATKAGIAAIEQLTADGVNVNATLLFSVDRYQEVAEAYIRGLRKRHQEGLPIDRIASVASFFISRVDALMDNLLSERRESASDAEKTTIDSLTGNIAIINGKRAYRRFKNLFGDGFAELEAAGARPQRLLWASTGTKNPSYSDVLYIESLIGANTVNTIPPATLEAFKDHGNVTSTLENDLHDSDGKYQLLYDLGVDVDAALLQLENEGVAAFAKSFENAINAIDVKLDSIRQETTERVVG